MYVYKIIKKKDGKKDNTYVKCFRTIIEINNYVDSINEEVNIGVIDSYDMILLSNVDNFKVMELLEHMEFGDFVKLVAYTISNGPIKNGGC